MRLSLFVCPTGAALAPGRHPGRGGRVVMQRPAKPSTPVRFRPPPPAFPITARAATRLVDRGQGAPCEYALSCARRCNVRLATEPDNETRFSTMMFRDRTDAGEMLARALAKWR